MRFTSRVLVAVAFSSVASTANQNQQRPLTATGEPRGSTGSPFTETLNKHVHQVMAEWNVPGLGIAVIDGQNTYSKGFGFAELPSVKVTPETLFFAGSTTKAITAAALSHMIDSEQYPSLAKGWSTPISSIIRDDFVVGDEWTTAHLTLEDAASHRTGIAGHEHAWGRRADDGSTLSLAGMVRRLRGIKLSAEPRTAWQYSHLMYVVLSHVVETLTGKWLGDYLRETIFAPLNMTATYCDTEEALAAKQHRLAVGYYWDKQAEAHKPLEFDSVREGTGAGFVITNVVDYAKWIRCLLQEAAPLSKQSHADIRTPRMLIADPEERTGPAPMLYGLGWQQKTVHGTTVYKHGGTEVAYATQAYWLPEVQFGVVIMANLAEPADIADEVIAWRLIEDKLGIPQQQRLNISKSLRDAADAEAARKEDAVAIMYPSRPRVPLPGLDLARLTGTYVDEGYGVLRIVETHRTSQYGDTVLLADRNDMLFMYELRFRHVSGDFWLIEVWYNDTQTLADFWGGEFTVGVDANVTALKVRLSPESAAIDRGTVWFKRA